MEQIKQSNYNFTSFLGSLMILIFKEKHGKINCIDGVYKAGLLNIAKCLKW